MHVYDTVTAAVNDLKSRGYTTDFNLAENCLVCAGAQLRPSDFHITEVYRFEGETDPGDEAVVYAIEGKDGSKGVLVAAYGAYAEDVDEEMLRKLAIQPE